MPDSIKARTQSAKETTESSLPIASFAGHLPQPGSHWLSLQRSIGNKAVQEMIDSHISGSQRNDVDDGSRALSIVNSETQDEPLSSAVLLRRASAEPGRPLDRSFKEKMQPHLGEDLSGVRIRSGPATEAAAESLGARAFTIGSNVYLGREGNSSSGIERTRLLAHEVVHTVQQGGSPGPYHGNLAVSHPGDPAEREAARIAESVPSSGVYSNSSPALALRSQLRGGGRPVSVSRLASPLVQRDLKENYPIREGKFRLDLTTESNAGGKSGMKGTIKFKAKNTAPDSTNIKLLQVVRTENLTTGKDHVYGGGEANRNKMMTAEDRSRGIEPGFFVDHSAAAANPRTKKTDPAVSPYYRDYWPNATRSRDGSKKGKAIDEASLWDFPGSSGPNVRFSFETLAKATDTGHVYGTVMWGFTVSDVAKGTVDHERAVGRNVTLATTDEAIKKFNEFYKNPGASTAP